MRPAPAADSASRTVEIAGPTGMKVMILSSAGSGAGTSGPRTSRPIAAASASETPGSAASALVCAVNSAVPARMSRCSSAPFGVSAATPCTPRSSSGWWVTSSCAPAASSTVAGTGSTANSTERTGSVGSPQTRPTASQSAASAGG